MDMDSNRCAVTDSEEVIDDCYIEIQFGYGSPRDLETYNFGPVLHEVGEDILEYIVSKMSKGKKLEDFKKKWQKAPVEHNKDWDLPTNISD
jgi:hypothetical protein